MTKQYKVIDRKIQGKTEQYKVRDMETGVERYVDKNTLNKLHNTGVVDMGVISERGNPTTDEGRYEVLSKTKQGNRNIYKVKALRTGAVKILRTEELGILCKAGLVNGYGGNEKRVYKTVEKSKPISKKSLKTLINTQRDSRGIITSRELKPEVVKHYQRYITDVEKPHAGVDRLFKCIHHNESVRPEGGTSEATRYQPRETPTVDVDTLDDLEKLEIKIAVNEMEVHKDLISKGYNITKEDIQRLGEQNNELYKFWEGFIYDYITHENEDTKEILQDVDYGVDTQIIDYVEWEVIRLSEGVYAYTGILTVQVEKVEEMAYERIEF